jgi:A/G-specific adenine glycosylase
MNADKKANKEVIRVHLRSSRSSVLEYHPDSVLPSEPNQRTIPPRHFQQALLAWYDVVLRDLPWRETTDFYRVWLSEIMLQQTRVEAVVPYFHRFLAAFPAIETLAAAPEQDVLAAWSGLGYYSRARNLHRAAKQVAIAGIPKTYEEIRALPGVGDYTAAAVGSIALGLPHAAVDGNVIRVISRLTNDPSEVSAPATKRRIAETAQALLDPRRPGDFNQAMMELGATICKPGVPNCLSCPVRASCAALGAGTQQQLPVKLKKPKTREVLLDLVVLLRGAGVFMVQRAANEKRLAGFWELPDTKLLAKTRGKPGTEFTHQIVNDRFRVRVHLATVPKVLPEGRWFGEADLPGIPVSTITRKALARMAGNLFHNTPVSSPSYIAGELRETDPKPG